MRKIVLHSLVLLLLTTAGAMAQTTTSTQAEVQIYVEGNAVPMSAITTQSALKKGWDIQGYNVGRKVVRYLDGAHAIQLADNQPQFAIYPTTVLNDYAIIRVKSKKDYRQLPAAAWADCSPMQMNINSFSISNLPDMGFAVRPLSPLSAGEYIIVNLKSKPTNEYGDFIVYDFTIK